MNTKTSAEVGAQVQVPSLVEILADIPDFRKARGVRYPLSALLTLACVAMMCGYTSQSAIAEWGHNYGKGWLKRLGIARAHSPSQSTLHRVFAGVDVALLEGRLADWAHLVLDKMCRVRKPSSMAEWEYQALAVDGKTLRGSRKQGAPGAHLLSAFSQRLGVVLRQVAVDDKSNEISAMTELLANLVLHGRLITGDALLTQRDVARAIVEAGGDYLLVVKDNQPLLRQDIQAVFEAPRSELLEMGLTQQELASQRCVCQVSMHGSRIEERVLRTSTALGHCYGQDLWPGLAQVMQVRRTITDKGTGRSSREVAYAITSLSPGRATPTQLLQAWREHWHIETRLHWVRDVTFREDQSQVHSGRAPQLMAALRNTAIALLRLQGEVNIAAACRRRAARPALAVRAVTRPLRL